MKLILFTLIFLFICFSSCTEPSSSSMSESGIEVYIDEKSDFQIIELSTLLLPPKVIILENREECLIGDLTEMQVFDGMFYILDAFRANGLFVFDMDGKFIRRIGRMGRGPGEYASISDFTIDLVRKELYLLGDQRIHKYAIDGTFIKTLDVKSLNRNLYRIQYYENHIYADVKGNPLSKDNEMLVKIDASSGKTINRYLKSTEYNYGWDLHYSTDGSSFKSRLNDPPLYSQMFMNQIISLKDMKAHVLINNENIPTTEDIDKLRQDILTVGIMALFNFPKMHSIHNYMEGNSFIFFNYTSNNRLFGVLCDTKENTVTVGFLKNDLVFKDSFFGTKIQFSDNKGAYSMITPDAMQYFMEALDKDELVENLDKIEQLRLLDDEPNPIIFYYEYKDAE